MLKMILAPHVFDNNIHSFACTLYMYKVHCIYLGFLFHVQFLSACIFIPHLWVSTLSSYCSIYTMHMCILYMHVHTYNMHDCIFYII